jgi:hypothetical protein
LRGTAFADALSLASDDDEAVARWAAQLGMPVATLHEAVAAIGTDIDKTKL